MANQIGHLLEKWYPQRDATQWVLGTIYKTEGSCYRKAGAMMLFGGQGQQYGLLSGGCLESGIRQHAQRVMMNNRTMTVCYDANDEDDLAFQLGIGCGGVVYILLQPIAAHNQYLHLHEVYEALQLREVIYYQQRVEDTGQAQAYCLRRNQLNTQDVPSYFLSPQPGLTQDCCLIDKSDSLDGTCWLISRIQPAPHILVVGGGIDAIPLVNIAHELGWETSLWDPRPANARHENFLKVSQVVDVQVDELTTFANSTQVNAAVLMSHNVKLDAEALKALHVAHAMRHLALLGPISRRNKVLKTSNLSESELCVPLSGPAGLDIGGELPESIALSIIAECHAALMQTAISIEESNTTDSDVAA